MLCTTLISALAAALSNSIANAAFLSSAQQQANEPYSVEYLTPPAGEVVEVGGMGFLPNGDLLVSTRRGRVWWVTDALAGDPNAAKWHIFCEGLHEGLGLKIDGERIYVLQRGELSELIDHDGDRVCDEVRTISQDWGMTGNYHEFAFGLPTDAAGNFYMSLNVGFWSPEWWHGISKAPYRGWILQVSPQGVVTPWAAGVRSPCGLGMNSAGDLFYTDNQGDWMGVCPIFHVEKGDFMGHPASLRWTEGYRQAGRIPSSTTPATVQRKPAAVMVPYEWSRSAGNLVEDQTGGKFGPFGGQMYVAELTNGTVIRTQMEKVRGQYQGAVFKFRDGIGSVCRVAFAPDGSLFTGFTNRGWGGLAPGHGVARLKWNGQTPFDMHSVHLLQDGFEINLTEALSAAPDVASIEAELYDYNYWWDYGSPQMNFESLAVTATQLSADGKKLTIKCDGLQAAKCVRITLKELKSGSGAPLLHDTFHYTINQMPEGPLSTELVSRMVEPPEAKVSDSEGWLHLSWGEALDRFESTGWELCDVELDKADPSKLVTRLGMGALVNSGETPSNLVSKQEFGDVEFRFNFMLPKGGDSGLYFMERYELQLSDNVGDCAGIVGVKGPRSRTAYRGPGQWHTVTGRFFAPRFDANGNKTRNAMFEQIALDGVMVIGAAEPTGPTGGGKPGEVALAPFYFQGHAGKACIGDIRIKPLGNVDEMVKASLSDSASAFAWRTVFDHGLDGGKAVLLDVPAEFELSGRVQLTDGPASELLFRSNGSDGYRLVLDGTANAPLKTGSMEGYAGIAAELIPAGTWFDLHLRCVENVGGRVISVHLNGVRFLLIADKERKFNGNQIVLNAGHEGGLKIKEMRLRGL
ncbi:MAG: DUF1080 domain-containing protein [Planctomycetes bacterium]|nr:DUF1080 domain-containing protein [Planctomycetota bacterium]